MNAYGKTFRKSIKNDMRALIIDDILRGDGMFQQSSTQEAL